MEGIAHKELGEGYYVHIDAYMKEPDGEERVAYHYDGDRAYTAKVYESKKGRKYFQVDGERLYLDEFKKEVWKMWKFALKMVWKMWKCRL